MLSIIKSMALLGLNGYLVDIQIDVSQGLPYFGIVGLPDASVKEAKERVKAAIKNSGYEILNRKIIVNLAPADRKKEGSLFDLPIAVGILACNKIVEYRMLKDTIIIGELSLDGRINKINGALPICIEARKLNAKRIILPVENAKEASVVQGIKVIGVKTLKEAIKYLRNEIIIEENKNNIEELLKVKNNYTLDFSEVKGQENIKRAIEIAAAGGHNLLMIGSARKWKNNAC